MKQFPNLKSGERIQYVLQTGEIRTGTFECWMNAYGTNYLVMEDVSTETTRFCFSSEHSIKEILRLDI